MAMSSSAKSPGRTPPFVLVALVLLVVILGYNYWTLSSSNRTMRVLNDKMSIEAKDTAEKRMSVEKNLETAREELRVVEGNLAQVKKTLQDKDTELNNLRAEQNKNSEELKQCKGSLAKCDEDLQTEKKTAENLNAEKNKLTEDLKVAKEGKPLECGVEACAKPIKDVLVITSKLVGTDKMSQALTEAKLDANKLMEGIEKVEPPAAAKAETEKPKAAPTNATKTA